MARPRSAPTCPTWVADPHEGVFTDQAVAYYEERAPRGEVVVCLGAAPKVAAGASVEPARARARSMAREGATSKAIVRALRDGFGLERNLAYAIALEAAKEEID